MAHVWLWLQFAAAAAIIIFCGIRITHCADALSEKFKVGHAFIGVVFVGWACALPELVISVSAVTGAGYPFGPSVPSPNLSLGNVIGSTAFNVFIIGLFDLCHRRGPTLPQVSPRLTLTASLSMLVVVLAGGWILIENLSAAGDLPAAIGNFHFGPLQLSPGSLLIGFVYFFVIRILYRFDQSAPAPEAPAEKRHEAVSLKGVLFKAVLAVVGVLIAGIWISSLGEEIAFRYGLQKSFVGTVFLAIVSSFPEVVTSIAAVRMRFYDMAVGDIFGSNIMDMFIILVADGAYRRGGLFTDAIRGVADQSPGSGYSHLVTVMITLTLSLIVIASLNYRSKRSRMRVGADAVLIILTYLCGLTLLFFLR